MESKLVDDSLELENEIFVGITIDKQNNFT